MKSDEPRDTDGDGKPRSGETARKILDAALALWNEKGYAQTTMRELGRRLGMGASSLYFYFRSKEEIVQFLYAEVNDEARARFLGEAAGGALDAGASFRRYLEIKLALLAPQRACLGAILKEAIDPQSALSPVSRDSARVLRESIGFFREIAAGHPGGGGDDSGGGAQPGTAALGQMLWLAHIVVLLYWLHDASPDQANTRRLVEMIAAGTAFLPMLGTVPGADEALRLLAAVLDPPPAAGTRDAAAAGGAGTAAAEPPARPVDVVVLGAGPIGILFASFLKLRRPRTSILVLDRAAEPGHKVGESTLSGFCRAVRSVGIRQETLERLFFPKNGLGFLSVDESVRDLAQAPEYVLEAFDQTFQVERRVLDSLLIANARRLGIDVVHGARASVKKDDLRPGGSTIAYEVGGRTFRARAALVADASGPAGVLPRALGLRTDDDVAFQTGSVWTYFSDVKPLASYRGWRARAEHPRDHYTQHLCFREGWLWYIPLVSWQGAPTANLSHAIDRLTQSARGAPARAELEETYACPARPIVSVGLSLRADRDPRLAEDPRGAFEHYARKYPAIRQLLDGAQNLPDYYGAGTTFMSRLNYRGHARQVAGDGWLLVGDAAFFVDPLISPGLTGGAAGAFQAAAAAAAALEAGDTARAAFAGYEAFMGRLQPALERDNELCYMSFNHPEALALVQRFQEIDARRHFHATRGAGAGAGEYGVEDTNVWGILDPAYQELQGRAWAICREEEAAVGKEVPVEEQRARDYERLVVRLRELLGPYVESHRDLTPYVRRNAGGAAAAARAKGTAP